MTEPVEGGIVLGGPLGQTECLTEDIVSTETAAQWLGKTVPNFHMWVRRHGLQPVHRVRVGRATKLAWSLTALRDAEAQQT